jgi:hypothetical protein
MLIRGQSGETSRSGALARWRAFRILIVCLTTQVLDKLVGTVEPSFKNSFCEYCSHVEPRAVAYRAAAGNELQPSAAGVGPLVAGATRDCSLVRRRCSTNPFGLAPDIGCDQCRLY